MKINMEFDIQFRKRNKDDIENYHKIRLDCLQNYPDYFGTLYSDELNSSKFKYDKIITEKSSNDFLMGSFKNNNLIGICGFIIEKKIKTRHIGEISGMCIQKDFSNKKIGTKLLQETIKTSLTNNQLEQIILSVVESNKTATICT